ncbi:MAG: hypothetical protein H7329_00325 [Opitutaceae bacterium]|nr:hypothetical protein [Cytophagales bacterium]
MAFSIKGKPSLIITFSPLFMPLSLIFKYFLTLLFCSCIHFLCIGKEVLLQDSTEDILLEDSNMKEVNPPAFLENINKKDRIWRKIEVISNSEEAFLLEGLSPHIFRIQIWVLSKGKITQYSAGRNRSFYQRYLLHKNFTFPLPKVKGSYTIWIALEIPEEGDIAFKIRSFRFFSEYAFHEYFFLGLYYGLLIIAGIYNFFLFVKSRIKLHLYYAAYMAGCILLSIREDGMAFQFLWPIFPSLNELIVFHLASPLFLLSFLVYSIAFLGLRKQKGILYALYILAFSYLFLEIFAALGLQLHFGFDWLLASISLIIYFSALRQAKNDLYSRYFVLGFSMVILGLLINLLRYFALIPSNIFTVYSFNFGIFFEAIIFSMALAQRVKVIQSERNDALSKLVVQLKENDSLQKSLIIELEEKKLLQDKVNRELEEKVRERTAELQTANDQLKTYASKVDQLNSALDLQNFSLKTEVKQATVSRLNTELVTFEKFKEIFSVENICLKTIEQLKWPRGFVCNKCGNTQSSVSQVWFKHKCSRCGSIESVTAHTLFHNTRIPLQKAFYITYLTFIEADISLDNLSKELELRKATVWLFRKKVKDRGEDKKYRKAETWQELIVDKH